MRVIAGRFRSRHLVSPRGTSTRPTSDRLRETLFNILAPRIEGCRFVDLYAGTGAVGIEAVSRGAAQVWFAENAPAALAAIRANLAALRISRGFSIEERGVGALLPQLEEPIDIIFLDPPYDAEAEYEGTLNFLGSARGRQLLASQAVVVAEHSSKKELPVRFGGLGRYRLSKQGDAALSFYRVSEKVQPQISFGNDKQGKDFGSMLACAIHPRVVCKDGWAVCCRKSRVLYGRTPRSRRPYACLS